MKETITKALNEACGDKYDLFERAFNDAPAPKHTFSSKRKRELNSLFKNCNNPQVARAKIERKLLRFGLRQAACVAAGFVVVGGLMFGGVKMTDMLSQIAEIDTETNKRYDDLVKDGNYYLNGDITSGIYFKVENGSIILCGNKETIRTMFLADEKVNAAHKDEPKYIEDWAASKINTYMTEIKFAIVKASNCYVVGENGENIPVDLLEYGFVENVDTFTEPWSAYNFAFYEYSLMFDGNKVIRLEPLGDFVFAG